MDNLKKLLEENKDKYKKYESENNFELALKYFEQVFYYDEEVIKEEKRNNKSDNTEDIQKKLEGYKEFYDQINEIIKICSKVNSKLDIDELIKILYDELSKIFKLNAIMIALCDQNLTSIDYSVFIEKGKHSTIDSYPIGHGKTVGEYCLFNKTPILINDIKEESGIYTNKNHFIEVKTGNDLSMNSMIYLPMVIKGNVTGYLSIQSYNKNEYNKNDILKLEILAGYISVAIENIKLYKGVEYISITDFITGLCNRHGVIKNGEQEYYKHKTTNSPLSIIMIDLDHLKKTNDTYGHLAGDQVLIGTSEAIKKGIRKSDIAGRYGGEEFLIILPNTGIKEALNVAERIRKNIEITQITLEQGKIIGCTASFGVYEFDNIDNFEEGIKKADAAMYNSKVKGRNMVSEYEN